MEFFLAGLGSICRVSINFFNYRKRVSIRVNIGRSKYFYKCQPELRVNMLSMPDLSTISRIAAKRLRLIKGTSDSKHTSCNRIMLQYIGCLEKNISLIMFGLSWSNLLCSLLWKSPLRVISLKQQWSEKCESWETALGASSVTRRRF